VREPALWFRPTLQTSTVNDAVWVEEGAVTALNFRGAGSACGSDSDNARSPARAPLTSSGSIARRHCADQGRSTSALRIVCKLDKAGKRQRGGVSGPLGRGRRAEIRVTVVKAGRYPGELVLTAVMPQACRPLAGSRTSVARSLNRMRCKTSKGAGRTRSDARSANASARLNADLSNQTE
jgi:hypothetical protein